MKKNYVILIVVCAFLLVLAAVWYYITRSTQGDFSIEITQRGATVEMPLGGTPITAEVSPGLRFKFDTGADISSISDDDIQRLRDLGYDVKESMMPISGRDGYGDFIFSPRRVTVSLPVGGYVREVDSTGVAHLVYSGKPTMMLHDVDFFPSGKKVSSFGLDVLKHFKLECNFRMQSLQLHDSLPAGYQQVVAIQKNIQLKDHFWSDDRCYIIVSVNQKPHIYLMDTGLQRASLKMPMAESKNSKHLLVNDSIHTMTEAFPAKIDESAWIDFGNRSGTKRVCYYDNPEDDYQINPLNVFSQDIVIDIDGGQIYFRPSVSMPAAVGDAIPFP